MKKTIITVLVTALVCFGITGATYAWLMAETAPVTNTFTVGDVVIRLSESAPRNNKLVPDTYLVEDPRVTVKAGSEDCWLFLKAEKSENFDTFLDYLTDESWLPLTGNEGVYYREVDSSADDQTFLILKNDKVHVKSTPTKAQLATLTEESYPSLSFTAYAVQRVGFDTPFVAWDEVKDLAYIH